jgi:ribonucleoside-diphosphate reductase alpha chain
MHPRLKANDLPSACLLIQNLYSKQNSMPASIVRGLSAPLLVVGKQIRLLLIKTKENIMQSNDNSNPLTTTFLDSFSEEIWSSTYKDYKDEVVDDSLYRVASAIASAEDTTENQKKYTDEFFQLLSRFKFVPGGRILANAGTEWKGTTLLNCFVGPRQDYDIDSLENIIKNLRNQSFTLKSEGGWGENFSYIRPRGAFIHGIGVETPGAVRYMELFDKSSEIITSGSGKKSTNARGKKKIRKGAMMAVLDCWHPDVIEFVTAKQQPGRLTKFNISVNCTDEFVNRVLRVIELTKQKASEEEINEADSWELRFPDTRHDKYKDEWTGNLHQWEEKGYPVIVYNTVSATWLWNLIMESTYNRAEPGVLFLDRANKYNPFYYGETISSTNPCGEQVLSPGNVCCLGSFNLSQYVREDQLGFDYDRLQHDIQTAVRFLDNVNTYSSAPLTEYKDSMMSKRRIGVGIMGWGSALFMLRVAFASEKADSIRDELMSFIATEAYKASIDLATEKGMFPKCVPELHAEGKFIQRLNLSDEYLEKLRTTGIRNSSLLSIQPTGNTGIFANVVSGGCEPVFMPEYIRTVIVNTMPDNLTDVCPKWYEGEWYETSVFKKAKEGDEDILKGVVDGVTYKIDVNRGLTKEVLCQDFGVRWLSERGQWDATADWAVTALTLTPEQHLSDLKGFAYYIDSAISKTINLPNKFSLSDFKNVYLDAYTSGHIKGVTTYRDGTMTTVLSAKEEKNAEASDEEIIKTDVRLPDSAPAVMKTLRAENRKWYLTVVYHEDNPNRPFALFVKTNAHEKNVVADEAVELLVALARKKKIPKRHIDDVITKIASDNNANKVARLISFLLRHGVLIKNIVAVLDRVESAYVGTFVFQIKKFLAAYIKDGESVEDEKCLSCGSTTIVYQEGCKVCMSCGNSKCG